MSNWKDAGLDFEQLVEAAGCMILIVYPDERIGFFNRHAEKITGYARDEAIGASVTELLNLTDESLAADMMPFWQKQRSGACEAKFIGKDGTVHWFSWTTHSLDDFSGSPGVLCIGHETTEYRTALDTLRDREAMLSAILGTAVDGIITIRSDGSIRSYNQAAEAMFGYKEQEVLGKNISCLMPAPYSDEHDDYISNYLETGIARIIGIGREVVGLRKDGSTFPAHLAVSELEMGKERFFTGIVRDITRQYAAEQRAKQAERLAAIGETVAGLAHESRNAFQRSQACLEMLALELEDQPDELELVERTQDALNHLHHLYEEVRDYAAPIILDWQKCNLAHVWRDAWSHLEVARDDKNVQLIEEIDGDLTVNIDWFAMGQVFRNILENAIYACANPGLIKVRCQEITLRQEEAIEVSILDNGSGFDDQTTSDQIFDAFFTTKTKGTGLGMAITKRIVEAHCGEIFVGSPESGAEIIVRVPRTTKRKRTQT